MKRKYLTTMEKQKLDLYKGALKDTFYLFVVYKQGHFYYYFFLF